MIKYSIRAWNDCLSYVVKVEVLLEKPREVYYKVLNQLYCKNSDNFFEVGNMGSVVPEGLYTEREAISFILSREKLS
jgi:hypothetical protein